MSGKSTLLRAVGANAVLAMAGAPVRAHALTFVADGDRRTIRVEDSLQDGALALLRAKFSASATSSQRRAAGVPCCSCSTRFSHGTNSHDRRIGAEAIVRALVEAGAIGAGDDARSGADRRWPASSVRARATSTSRIASKTEKWCSTTACATVSSTQEQRAGAHALGRTGCVSRRRPVLGRGRQRSPAGSDVAVNCA